MKRNGSSKIAMNDLKETVGQIEVELAILLGVEQSLRLVLQWMTRDRGNSRKLSTLRFMARSFERHLARTRILADHSGYKDAITDANPHLVNEMIALRTTRDELQSEFERIILRLEDVSPDDGNSCEEVCAELEGYLDQLSLLGHKEMELLQKSFVREEGGEG